MKLLIQIKRDGTFDRHLAIARGSVSRRRSDIGSRR
jgi:hypothetical protein